MPRALDTIIVPCNNLGTMRLVIQRIAVEIRGTMLDGPGADLVEEGRGVLEGIARVDGGGVRAEGWIFSYAGIFVCCINIIVW